MGNQVSSKNGSSAAGNDGSTRRRSIGFTSLREKSRRKSQNKKTPMCGDSPTTTASSTRSNDKISQSAREDTTRTYSSLISSSSRKSKEEQLFDLAHDSKAMQVARTFVQGMNDHDTLSLFEVVNIDAIFTFPGGSANGGETIVMPAKDFLKSMLSLVDSMSDLSFHFDRVVEVKRGLVRLIGFNVTGTHLGAPLVIPPHLMEPIPATGAVIKDPPMDIDLEIKKGGITSLGCRPWDDELRGPPSIYMKAKAAYMEQQERKKDIEKFKEGKD